MKLFLFLFIFFYSLNLYSVEKTICRTDSCKYSCTVDNKIGFIPDQIVSDNWKEQAKYQLQNSHKRKPVQFNNGEKFEINLFYKDFYNPENFSNCIIESPIPTITGKYYMDTDECPLYDWGLKSDYFGDLNSSEDGRIFHTGTVSVKLWYVNDFNIFYTAMRTIGLDQNTLEEGTCRKIN
jgi:hypothetical protein|tara:strand:+ start:391 stop:930 length:540 start_codon:yes stop_codon:yes gene_type:complete